MVDILKYLNEELMHHCKEVTEVTRYLCGALNLGTQETDWLCRAAEIHDIGKWYISDEVLSLCRGLNQIEREVVDMHSYWGYLLAKQEGESGVVCDLVLLHHGEKYSSYIGKISPAYTLYPILMASDIYCAMMSNRSYRMAVSHQKALEIVSEQILDTRLLSALGKFQSS